MFIFCKNSDHFFWPHFVNNNIIYIFIHICLAANASTCFNMHYILYR